MKAHGRQEAKARARLDALAQALRRACPEILSAWAEAHIRVRRAFLSTLPASGPDAETARYVARSAVESWGHVALDGAAFIAADTPWLEGCLERLDRELEAPRQP